MTENQHNTNPSSGRDAKTPISFGNIKFFYQISSLVFTASLFIALTIWSWKKWPDILVDFGHQLYIPWQLAGGRHLYTDLAVLHGPFSQYFNAFWFYIFGPSLDVIIYINLIILALTTVVIYKTFLLCTDLLTATSCIVVFLCVFAFGQYVGIGNYNWITPYTHEATHGVALIAALILFGYRFVINRKYFSLMIAALCFGISLLTKIDTAIAAMVVALFGFTFAFLTNDGKRKFSMKPVLLFIGTAAVPVILFFIYFLTYMSPNEAMSAVCSGLSITSNDIFINHFFKHVMGTDDLSVNLFRMAIMSAFILSLIFTAVIIDVFAQKWLHHPLVLGIPLSLAIFFLLMFMPELFPWDKVPRSLLPLTILSSTVFIILFFKSFHEKELRLKIIPMIVWTVFAFALLMKIAFRVRISHYGFYLSMPATLVIIACLLYWIPEWLKIKYKSGNVFRMLVIVFLINGVIYFMSISNHYYNVKTFPIGNGKDMFFTYQPDIFEPAAIMDLSLKWIEEHIPPDATFAVIPEGVMINYLTRRKTSVPITNFMMTELTLLGEDRILNDFKSHPPDYIILAHKNSAELGAGPFGVDPQNGRRIMQWVNLHYTPVALFGNEPLQQDSSGTSILIGKDNSQTGIFGIKILKRKFTATKEIRP